MLYYEYYGTIAKAFVGNWHQNNSNTDWVPPEKKGQGNAIQHTSYTSTSGSATDQYITEGSAKYSPTIQPYISVYFWKRTA